MNIVATPRTAGPGVTFAVSCIAACLLSALSVPVNAAPLEAPSLSIKYDARALTTPGGVRTLYRRLAAAAREVCMEDSSRGLSDLQAAHRCEQQSIARAVRQINNSQLAEMIMRNAHRG